MTEAYRGWSLEVRRLYGAVCALEPWAHSLSCPTCVGEEWHELLVHKIVPQLEGEPLLIVAVVGGTNLGKSVIFNHLAGETASAVSPLAAGTRHPVCLVPEGLNDEEVLPRLFEGFELCPWHAPEDPLDAGDVDRLFWRHSAAVPPRLLVLDTPDIDSDVQVNWRRADQIRRSADVLVAVLTQQKYNDAAVKHFFREAAAADKPIVVVFNQCDMVEDRSYWPEWLATFTGETNASPDLVYVCPYDRQAAQQLRLPFHAVGHDGRQEPSAPRSLRDDLAHLCFDEIKIRTFRGALSRVLDPSRGGPRYLARLQEAAGEFARAADALSAAEMARVEWPALPPRLLVDEIRAWWDNQRSPISRKVHGFYRTVGKAVVRPIRAARDAILPAASDPADSFADRERDAVVIAVGKLMDELGRLATVGSRTLAPRLEALLKGSSREQLLQRVIESHARLPAVDDDYRRYLREELDRWGAENSRAVNVLRSLDNALAFARPVITVSLAVSGWVVAGGIVHEAAAQLAGHTATELATEAAITGGIAGGGEALVGTTGEGLRRAAAQLFRRLQVHYAESRAHWLAEWLERELLGDLLSELRRGTQLTESEPFRQAQSALANLAAISAGKLDQQPAC